jgi:lipopolysaccharide export system protein LptA
LQWRGALPAAAVVIALLAPAHAQAPVSGFSSIGGDNAKKPINIESDLLEVDDKKHVAIFTGNVTAIQGDYTLRAPRIEVTYDKQEQPASQDRAAPHKPAAPKPANGDAAADPLASGQIRFIHATGGKVVVTSTKDEQEATGEDAVYDVKGQTIVMTGKEVILTQKKSIVKGKQLNVDLATSRATVIPEKGHKMQAVFTQEGKFSNPLTSTPKAKEKAPAPEAPKPAEGDPAWRTQNN